MLLFHTKRLKSIDSNLTHPYNKYENVFEKIDNTLEKAVTG